MLEMELPHGRHPVKEGIHQLSGNQAHPAGLIHVNGVDGPALIHQARVHGEIVVVAPGDGHGGFIAVVPGGGGREAHRGGNALHMVQGREAVHVLGGEAALQVAARGGERQRPRAHGGEGIRNGGGHPRDGGNQRDDRRNADHNAQNGQKGAHAVLANVAHGHAHAFHKSGGGGGNIP